MKHHRINLFGFHVAVECSRHVVGLAVWPPGAWPKAPWLYLWKVMQ